MKKLIGFIFFLNGLLAYSQPMRMSKLNLDHFSVRQRSMSNELSKLCSRESLAHPEIGIKPFDSPPGSDYIELVDRRDELSRYYVKKNTNGSDFIVQKSSGPINYRDQFHFWREINYRLERKSDKLFVAPHQPEPVGIDLENRTISLKNQNNSIVSKIPELVYRDANGLEQSLGEPDLSNFTSGDDGIKIINAYPGIDLVFSVRRGEVETSFILNHRLSYSSGEIILRQQVSLPENLRFDVPKNNSPSHEEIYITDKKNVPYFNVEKGYAFDNSSTGGSFKISSRVVDGDKLEFYVPVSWLSSPSTVYPVIIDPVVTTQNTVIVAGISGTKYSAVCWANSCDNTMIVPTPANTTITGIYHSFEFYATGACFADDGGYSIDYNACHAPSAPPGVYTNAIHITNAFFTAVNVLITDFNACLPAPQCASQNLNFTLHFFRCNNDTDSNCNSNCIRATQPWTMFVEGHAVEVASITATQQICAGSSALMVGTPQYGVSPYTFSWSHGGTTDDSLTVTPATSTTYTLTVTDACGITASATSTVNVTLDNNPGFTITSNPACINVPITLNGNGVGPAANYDWIVAGSNAPGGSINDQQSPSVTYTVAGNYDVILNYPNGVCVFKDTVQLTVNPLALTSIAMTQQPAGAICQGDVVTFHANPTNGGAAPTYNWLIDGVSVQNGASDSLVTSALNNGSQVDVILQSNAFCSAPLVDTATLFIAVANALNVQATISPDTAVCPGSALTLNAAHLNGGATPTYQWYANGVPVPGATSSSYSFTVTPPDTIIGVVITSSLACVTSQVAADTSIISILQNIQPLVTMTANPAGIICSGDSIHYSAHPTFGGPNPQYLWFVNGIPSGISDSVFTVAPVNNDSISVQLTSSLTCVAPTTDDDYMLAGVSLSVSPVVALSVTPAVISCVGDTVIFTAGTSNAGSTPVYSWTINGNPVGINDSIFTSSTLNDNDVVQVILNSSLGCAPIPSDTDVVTVSVVGNVAPSVTVNPSGNALCNGDTLTFIAGENNGGSTPVFQWYLNGVATGTNDDTLIVAGLNNNDIISVDMTSSLACVAPPTATSPSFTVNLLPKVSPQIVLVATPSDTVCVGQQVSIQANIQNGGNNPAISWYVNSILSNVTGPIFPTTTFGSGDVIVANLTSDANCLISPGDTSNFIRVVYHAPLIVWLSSSPPDCPGEPATIYANISGGTGGPYQTVWSNGSVNADSIVVNADQHTNILVQVDDGCTVVPALTTYSVPVLTGPVSDFAYQNPSPGSFQNNIQFINLSTDADNWIWFFDDSTGTSIDLNPLHQFPREGTYDVMLATQNNNGCVDTVTYHVSVQEEIAVFYPNSFTPNGDGKNDLFQPLGASLEDYEMTIYNRWGELIYTGNSKMAWDGRINNSSTFAPEGVYIFRIDLKEEKFPERVVTGRVTVIR